MNTGAMPLTRKHHGRNIKKIRESLDVEPEALAEKLNLSLSELSNYEDKVNLEDALLEKIANELSIPVMLLKNLTDDSNMTFFLNTFRDMSMGAMGINNISDCNFAPIDKIIELYEGKEKLLLEKIADLEKRLKSEEK